METPQTRLSPLEKVQLQIKTLQNKVVFLTEENKQLKQTIKELKRTTRPSRSSVNRIDTA
jgi:peptidoglycan hydrolase CwlO-like protein